MLETLISSKTRINLLLKFFLNPERTAYLRGLAEEFGESTNSIRLELNKFEDAGMLSSSVLGNRKIFRANQGHPLFPDIRNIIIKHIGVDQLVDYLVGKLGNLQKVYLTGDFAKGRNSQIIDIIVIGDIDKGYLVKLVEKLEAQIHKKIRYLIYHPDEVQQPIFEKEKMLLIWSA